MMQMARNLTDPDEPFPSAHSIIDHEARHEVLRNIPGSAHAKALACIERRPPTLVISDVIMPQMDGYELRRRIKQAATLRNIPMILLTSLTDPADVVKGPGMRRRQLNFQALKLTDVRFVQQLTPHTAGQVAYVDGYMRREVSTRSLADARDNERLCARLIQTDTTKVDGQMVFEAGA